MFAIIENAEKQAEKIFYGLAIPCDKSTVDGGTIRSEKVLKFSRKHLGTKKKNEKADPRYRGGDDLMIEPVGKPGSRERIEALADQYARLSLTESSAFGE